MTRIRFTATRRWIELDGRLVRINVPAPGVVDLWQPSLASRTFARMWLWCLQATRRI